MKIYRLIAWFLAVLSLPLNVALADDTELGSISFSNSGAAGAQTAFLTGVKALHSFQFDEARFAFEEAQKIDPSFALAYWGQAMSDNHPLWAQQDMAAATAALKRLAPTFSGRLAKAETEKEKAYLTAIESLYYSADDKLERDFAYSDQMARMHERWPEDDEVSAFYALSLLGTVRQGDQGYRRQALAASIAQSIFTKNEQHPGGAHFIIHSFDDPDHAILALPAATVYAEIAPASAHALHMPSHIFLQLGRWQDVVDSNIDAYSAAVAVINEFGLSEGREDFHTLSWRAYAYLMLGDFDEAAKDLALAKDTMARNPDSARIHNGYLNILSRHVLETQQWDVFELAALDSVEGSHASWVSVVGMSAAHRGDSDLALNTINRLAILSEAAQSNNDVYGAKQIAILQKETMAVMSLANGDTDTAIAQAGEAAQMEIRDMQAPSGPPVPMKPAAELYADILLAANRPVEALAAYQQSLQWIPLRTPSIVGMEKARASSDDSATAE
ncbi:MAG: tetratricopeptide (TPR) repeat protein [Granulosicoccus sp.]|jgi:tetratricopeptide (TPR) repeat protein